MKPFISLSTYGVINWLAVVLLLGCPWALGFYKLGGAALFLPLLFGWIEFIMAVFSNNKHGFFKQMPMEMHLFLDVIIGSFLFMSPFIFHFSDKVVWPQVLIGGLVFIAGAFTHKSPFTDKYRHHLPEGQLQSVDSES
ncbi:SPW repeat domain-containing protein [Mucilaginibacter sp.]